MDLEERLAVEWHEKGRWKSTTTLLLEYWELLEECRKLRAELKKSLDKVPAP